jgi:hypothetical protein
VSGVNRNLYNKKSYPGWFRELCSDGLCLLIEMMAEDSMAWATVIALWDLFLDEFESKFPESIRTGKTSTEKWRLHINDLRKIADRYLDMESMDIHKKPVRPQFLVTSAAEKTKRRRIRANIEEQARMDSGRTTPSGIQNRALSPSCRGSCHATYGA